MARILIIEDEPAIVDNIAYALRTEGFEVEACSTGQEGLSRAQSHSMDLIVLDVGLPDANGFEICKELRKSVETPVIFLTARADAVDRVVGLEIGGDDYMVKPFSPRELAARVKAVLRRTDKGGEKTGPQTQTRGSFEIDRHRMRIHFRSRALELSRCEFKILETLINRPGWVFSRQQLMERVSDEPAMSTERTIDTHIKTLRGKLKDIDPEADPIQTHRGFGYSLRDAE